MTHGNTSTTTALIWSSHSQEWFSQQTRGCYTFNNILVYDIAKISTKNFGIDSSLLQEVSEHKTPLANTDILKHGELQYRSMGNYGKCYLNQYNKP